MRSVKLLFIFSIPFIIIACAGSGPRFFVQSEPDGSKMLVGEVLRDTLFAYFPEWEFEYKYYQPDPQVLDSITQVARDISVEIYLGTWCGDSRREVPHFFKLIDTFQSNPFEDIRIWAVNRDKIIPESDITVQRGIERVASFIFFRNGREIGRVVESPDGLLESDILNILNRSGN